MTTKARKSGIVTVGGGTGSPTINRALLLAGVDHINAIAAMFDNGGHTGERRRRALDYKGQDEVAYSDAIRILTSLVDPTQVQEAEVIKEWFTYKNGHGEVPGYGLADSWFDSKKAFHKLENDFKKLHIKLRGTVLPSSTEPAHITFSTQKGSVYQGENMLDELESSPDMVSEMHLDPSVPAYAPAREAIEQASTIFLSCGSVHGSVLCNFLPVGMKDALAKSHARIYLITNLVSSRNETNEFSPQDYLDLVARYSGIRPHGIIVPEMTRKEFEAKYPQVAILYAKENSRFLGWEKDELSRVQAAGVQVITHRATKLVDIPEKGKTIVRHSPEDLAPVFHDLLFKK